MDNSNTKKRHALRDFWLSRGLEGGVEKQETFIQGLDELLEGGLPKGRATLVSAGPGAGKTVLLSEFIYRGAAEAGEPGIFLTFEERPEDIRRNLRNFGWDFSRLEQDNKLVFLDAASAPEAERVIGGAADWIEPTLLQVRYQAEQIGAKRLAIDNLGTAFMRYAPTASVGEIRQQLFRFADRVKALGLTTMFSTERSESDASLARYGVEEFVADGLIQLDADDIDGAFVRTMIVRKLRGCGFRPGRVSFQIGAHGIDVYPKIPIDTSVGETNFDVRKSMGVPALDKAMGGGLPEGHVLLVAGNTGTGKTTLALHYLMAGLTAGESAIWVALEEPVLQIVKTARAHDWDLEPYLQSGQLAFVTAPLMTVYPDQLLYRVLDTVSANGSRRLVIDSISSLESGAMDKNAVRDFMLQLSGFCKTQGMSVLMNYLSGEAFGAGRGQLLGSMVTNELRLSSIVDAIILLRYVERDQGVRKLLNILKLRGSQHVKDILQFEIDRSGFTLGHRFGIDG